MRSVDVDAAWEQVRSVVQSETDHESFELARELARTEISQMRLASRLTASIGKDLQIWVAGRKIAGKLTGFAGDFLCIDSTTVVRVRCVVRFAQLPPVLEIESDQAAHSGPRPRVLGFSIGRWLRDHQFRDCLLWQGESREIVRLMAVSEDCVDVAARQIDSDSPLRLWTLPLQAIDVLELREC